MLCDIESKSSAAICLKYNFPESTTWKFEENDDGTLNDYGVIVEKDGGQMMGYSGCYVSAQHIIYSINRLLNRSVYVVNIDYTHK